MAIENESNQMVLFLNLADLFLRNQEVEKIEKNWSFTTTDEGFLEKLRISNPFLEIEWIRSYTYARKVIKKERRGVLLSFIT